MLNECIEQLNIKPDGIYVVGTAGGAGHSSEIAKRLTTGKLIALDKDPDAIKTAQENAEKLNVSERVNFKTCDVFNIDFFGKFDLVISNPPYIESDVISTLSETVKDFEPISALDGGNDGLDFYKHIINIAPKYLCEKGMLAFEIGYNQKDSVSSLMASSFTDINAIKDYGDNYRVISGIIK